MFTIRKDPKGYTYFCFVAGGAETFRSQPYLKVSTGSGIKWVAG